MMLSGALIPLSVLPVYILKIAPLLPFSSVYYLPLMQILGPFDILTSVSSLILQMFWFVVLSLLVVVAWRIGFSRYDAPGG